MNKLTNTHYKKAQNTYEKAIEFSKPNIVSRLQGVLDKHNYKDVLICSSECQAFLKDVKSKLNGIT